MLGWVHQQERSPCPWFADDWLDTDGPFLASHETQGHLGSL